MSFQPANSEANAPRPVARPHPPRPWSLRSYAWLMDHAGPLLSAWLTLRSRRGKEDAARRGERFGQASKPRPPGPLVWIHGASLGEALSAFPVLAMIHQAQPKATCLVTTQTVTSARLLADRLPPYALHQFLPFDQPKAVDRFLSTWQPDAVFWLESELWPNFLAAVKSRGCPMVLVNARLSERSFAGWRKRRPLFDAIMSGFDLAIPQEKDTAERLRALGFERLAAPANLKYAAQPLPVAPGALAAFQDQVQGRPLWLGAQTAPPEEAILGRAHQRLTADHPHLLTVLVPRHPERGPEIAEELQRLGLSVARRSLAEPITPETAIYLADTIGELGLFYRAAEIVFLGRSLAPLGGSNPLEPARLHCAILQGPRQENFAVLGAQFSEASAHHILAPEIETQAPGSSESRAMAEAVSSLLKHPEERRRLALAAERLAESLSQASSDVSVALRPYLQTLAAAVPASRDTP